MATLFLSLFVAGILTILLPCILPLLPVVVGVSVLGRNRLRPLLVVLGMVVSFVVFTFLLLVVLHQFVELADILRTAMFVALLLFGCAFAFEHRFLHILGAVLGGFYFYHMGLLHVSIAVLIGVLAFVIASNVAGRLQQTGLSAQQVASGHFGADSPLTAFVIGLTLGFVWVPCAGPALGLALTLVRDEPGLRALLALTCYALGTALPLLLVGYGGQRAVHSVRALAPYTGVIKRIAGVLLILTSLALQFHIFERFQVFLVENTSFGDIGTRLEERLFRSPQNDADRASSLAPTPMAVLPKLSRAPSFSGLGPWHNTTPLTKEDLEGKVILVDFWTYSCINCIRTLPYIQGYWEKYKGTGKFVVVAVHTPEFTFEKSPENVAQAIERHHLTYPVAQDNNFSTWSAFANHYWPAKYLIDANGYIRYTHFGEGNYEETDAAIASLLAEAGVASDQWAGSGSTVSARNSARGPITPETYLSSRSWPAFGNAQGEPSDAPVTYQEPTITRPNAYYLVGQWQLRDDEYQVNLSETGDILMRFTGGEANLVLGLDAGASSVKVEVIVDGKPTTTFTVDHHDLYNLFTGPYGTHDLRLKIQGKGLQVFAWTFGH